MVKVLCASTQHASPVHAAIRRISARWPPLRPGWFGVDDQGSAVACTSPIVTLQNGTRQRCTLPVSRSQS